MSTRLSGTGVPGVVGPGGQGCGESRGRAGNRGGPLCRSPRDQRVQAFGQSAKQKTLTNESETDNSGRVWNAGDASGRNREQVRVESAKELTTLRFFAS